MIEKQNGQISVNQFTNLLTMELFSVMTLFLPGFLGKRLSGDAICGYVIGVIGAVLYVWLLIWVWKSKKERFYSYQSKKFRFLDIVYILFLLQLIWGTVFVLNMAGEVVRSFLLPQLDRFSILFVFYLVCLFGAYKGIECRGRMAEFLGIVCWILFLFFLVVSIRKIDMNQYETLLVQPGKEILKSSYEIFLLFQLFCLGLLGGEQLNEKKRLKNVLIKSFTKIIAFSFLLLMILLGIFGADYMGELKWPAIQLLRNITESGRFISRLDIFMVFIWIVSFFFFVSGGLIHSGHLLETVLGMKKNINCRIVLFSIVFLLAWFVGNPENAWFLYKNYMYYIGAPFTVLGLLIVGMQKRKKTFYLVRKQN